MKKVFTVDDILKLKESDSVYLHSGMIITPAARDLAAARGIKVEHVSPQTQQNSPQTMSPKQVELLKNMVAQKIGDSASSQEIENGTRAVLEQIREQIPEVKSGGSTETSRIAESMEMVTPTSSKNPSVVDPVADDNTQRLIISVVGLNQPGVVAGITAVISDLKGNIADISQRIMDDFFVMIIVVDMSQSRYQFDTFADKLQQKGDELKVKVWVQHEDVFRFVHRV